MAGLDVLVDLDPRLGGDLTRAERIAAEVHVLHARAELLRGPVAGDRALLLAVRAADLRARLLAEFGVEAAAAALRATLDHAATLAAIERWRLARELADRLLVR